MVFSVIVVALCSSERINAAAQAGPKVKLWAAIGVARPVFQLHETENMAMSFVVVNDGEIMADPSVESSDLFVNGVEPKDWSFVIGNGPRNSYFKALPPGQILSFGYQLGPSDSRRSLRRRQWQSGQEGDVRMTTTRSLRIPCRHSFRCWRLIG